MENLQIPELLKGQWEHVLIMTYGMNLSFFENALLPQFSAKCRNKIIIGDGQRYLDTCQTYAHGGLVRYLNQLYVAEGIFVRHAAHAKLILLTDKVKGRLLVGSGNLSLGGFASGGELFCQYQYDETDQASLNAFLAVKELLEWIINKSYISAQAQTHILRLLNHENTPWLYNRLSSNIYPVRHNAHTSFLEQLKDVVGNEKIKELIVLSPFYDREAIALSTLLEAFHPDRTVLLMQQNCTSVDLQYLERILADFQGYIEVRQFELSSKERTYIHAKLYLLKTEIRAICLQGSPNLSTVAMLLNADKGNIELANLLIGKPDEFDYLFENLKIDNPISDLESLDLSYVGEIEEDSPRDKDKGYLRSAEWYGDKLTLVFSGDLPDFSSADVRIGSTYFNLPIHNTIQSSVEIELSSEIQKLLQKAVPISLCWRTAELDWTTNSVFACNRQSLEGILSADDHVDTLNQTGSLELDDYELEHWLSELDSSLIIDPESIWRITNPSNQFSKSELEPAGSGFFDIDYANVDYEQLYQHPKYQQYKSRFLDGRHLASNKLQIILNSITSHFNSLIHNQHQDINLLSGLQKRLSEIEYEEEMEETEDQQSKKTAPRTNLQKTQRILKKFINRYIGGMEKPAFHGLVGFEVMTQNYAIFTYILFRLFSREWLEPQFLSDSIQSLWRIFWGDQGYFWVLSDEEWKVAKTYLRDYHADAILLASLYHCADLVSMSTDAQHGRLGLRDTWRRILVRLPFDLNGDLIEEVWYYVDDLMIDKQVKPSDIVRRLEQLAGVETEQDFFRAIESMLGYSAASCRFKHGESIYRPSTDKDILIDHLIIKDPMALSTEKEAQILLGLWMRFKPRSYCLVTVSNLAGTSSIRVASYDPEYREGFYTDSEAGIDITLHSIPPLETEWHLRQIQLQNIATLLDQQLSLPLPQYETQEIPK